jgi:hypothetical protein
VVIARTDNASRLMARVPAEDTAALARLTSLAVNPIGSTGRTTPGADGHLVWSFA